jgi:hypothetical protein
MGELIANSVYRGVQEAIFNQNGIVSQRSIYQRLRERNLSIFGVIDRDCPCAMKGNAIAANRTREIRPSGMRGGAYGNVGYGGTRNPPHITKGCVPETLRLRLCAPYFYQTMQTGANGLFLTRYSAGAYFAYSPAESTRNSTKKTSKTVEFIFFH